VLIKDASSSLISFLSLAAAPENGSNGGATSGHPTTELNTTFNKVILIGRLGKNAEVKTAQNNKDFVVLSVATSESWRNDKGEYDTRTEWHRVYAWGNLTNFAKTLQKGQLVSLEGKIKYRTVEEEVKGQPFKHTIAEIRASSMKRLSKVQAADDPADSADDE
jgi:single-strand DNA-binding protein